MLRRGSTPTGGGKSERALLGGEGHDKPILGSFKANNMVFNTWIIIRIRAGGFSDKIGDYYSGQKRHH